MYHTAESGSQQNFQTKNTRSPAGKNMGESYLKQRNCSFYDVSATFSVLTYKRKEDTNVKGQNKEQVKK